MATHGGGRGRMGALLARVGLMGALALGTSCASVRPPAQSSGPAASPEGVRLTLIGQSCTQTEDSEDLNHGVVEVRAAVQVQNPTRDPVTIDRRAFLLSTEGAPALRDKSWGAAKPVAVNPGQSSALNLRFTTEGLSCANEMVLQPGPAIATSSGPIAMPDVRFRPFRAL